VTLTNGGGNQPNNPGAEFTDVLPAGLTLVSATANSGTATATVGTNTVTWDGAIAPAGSVTITITATINSCGPTISNQGTISYDADANGTNEATHVTDDPGTQAANDPTVFNVTQGALVTATKTAPTTVAAGQSFNYTVTLTNSGCGAQGDNPGNEFTDTLPTGVTLTGASAVGNPGPNGTTTAVPPTVTWNGSIPAGGTVTITISATVNQGTTGVINNQGTVNYDSNNDGTNDASGVTDNPGSAATGDPTPITVSGFDPAIPTLSEWGLALLCLALTGAALMLLRRRRTA
jgi:fimbrial isopeptide formation D2 family protein/uncharacterized repeat protein (TIGR01451 family)